jgi:hypothetical protein
VSAGILVYNWESFFPDFSKEARVSKIAGSMPCKDRKRLDYFFRRLMFWDSGSYVLMGSKPCSIAVFEEPSNFSSLMPSNLRLWLGWRTWKKYEKYFPHPCFSIIKEKTGKGTSLLIFVNNLEFVRMIASHRNDFEKILQKSIEPDKVLSEAETSPLFSGVFQNNDFLIGMLLGFGRENSWLYYSNHQLSENPKQMISFTAPEENERFLNHIRSHGIWGCASGSLFSDFSEIQLPGFVVDPNNSETIELRRKYSADRQKIIEYYDKKNFLDATLELLTKSL